jgi:hypothetical protein
VEKWQLLAICLKLSQKRCECLCLPKRLNIVGTVGTSGEVGQVELNLIPALVQSHGHRADEWLDAGRALVVRGAETSAHVLIIQYLHLKRKVLLQLQAKTGVVSKFWSHR